MEPVDTLAEISVIIPAYQASDTIARAIQSVAIQTLPPTEIIVVDDGSDDGTADIAQVTGEQVSGSSGIRFTLLTQQNLGAGAARNAAIISARGEYIAFLDADDEWLPDKLLRSIHILESQSCDLVSHDFIRVEGDTQLTIDCARHFLGPGDPFVSYFLRGYIATSTVVARRSVLIEVGGFDPSLRSGQDFELWLVVISNEKCIYHVFPEALTRYHVVAASITTQVELRRLAAFRILRRHHQRLLGHAKFPRLVASQRALIIDLQAAFAHKRQKNNTGMLKALISIPKDVFTALLLTSYAAKDRPNFLSIEPENP